MRRYFTACGLLGLLFFVLLVSLANGSAQGVTGSHVARIESYETPDPVYVLPATLLFMAVLGVFTLTKFRLFSEHTRKTLLGLQLLLIFTTALIALFALTNSSVTGAVVAVSVAGSIVACFAFGIVWVIVMIHLFKPRRWA